MRRMKLENSKGITLVALVVKNKRNKILDK